MDFLIPTHIPRWVEPSSPLIQLPHQVSAALDDAFKRFAHNGRDDADGEHQSGYGDVPSRLFHAHQATATRTLLQRLAKGAKSGLVRKKAASWNQRMAQCGRVPRRVFLGDLLQNPVGYQTCRLDISPIWLDAKRRRYRRRFLHVFEQGFKSDLDVLHVTPVISLRYFADLATAYELNRLAWTSFADSNGFWRTAVEDWCRGRHIEQEFERGQFRWNVHDHLVLVLRAGRKKAMSNLDRVRQRIEEKWNRAVQYAADELGLDGARGTVDVAEVHDLDHATSLSRYLTHAPLQRASRKRLGDLEAALSGQYRPRRFSDLDLPQAEEFISALRHHRYFFMSKAAEERTKKFSSKERVPDKSLRTKEKSMEWHIFRQAVKQCAHGEPDILPAKKALSALPHVVASLFVFGRDSLAFDLIDDWLLILKNEGG